VNADERRLKQMLVNLLTNAIKFTPDNGRLGLDVYGSAEEGLINLTVWDTGIGIKADDMPRLFQPFVQLDSSLARMYSGTGLGLSLVLRMAELHGGGISVQSEPGKGSRFTIQLPWPPEPVEIPGSELGRGTEIPRVALIVEENPSDAEQLGKFLKMLGFATKVHASSLDVLELAADERPGVILLDLNLSAKPGLRILAELQADERTNSIPVIITASMTSSVGYYVENRAQALALGAVDIMVKPVTLPVLRSELELAAAKLRAHEAELQDGSPVNIPGNLTTNPLVLLAEDSEITRELMIDFLQSQHFRTLAASSGMELLNLVAENPPDIILMDIQMPDMDGLETMQRLRAHSDPRLATVPIIAVTALAMAGDRERCLEAGANEYMSKPISLTKLLDVIQGLLKTTRIR
jgi:CheY-like chemotaxis protein